MSDMERIRVTYRVTCRPDEVETLGRDIAFEQTVEIPESLLDSPRIRDEVVGHVESIEPEPGRSLGGASSHAVPGAAGEEPFRVVIGYNASLAAGQVPQLLNLLYGNISMKRKIRLVDVVFPESVLSEFPGPRFGEVGLRRLAGVEGRPFLSTALKPLGKSAEEFADLAHHFALGGGDLVKDDHNLFDRTFDEFRERVTHCQRGVERANEVTSGTTLYFPNLSAPVDQLAQRIEFLLEQGIRGVLVAPLLLGLDTLRWIRETYPLVLMAHPAATGAYFHDSQHGIAPEVLLGTLFRLLGADVSIFPNAGGRFTFSSAECGAIAESLRRPLGTHRAALPAPAGGMRFDNLEQLRDQFGRSAVLLIGGALLGHHVDLSQGTRAFAEQIARIYLTSANPGHAVTDAPTAVPSACEFPSPRALGRVLQHIPFRPGFRWEGRPATAYKGDDSLPFRDVSRVELIGRNGEQTEFDVRYFQIERDGFSSLEHHHHTHAIVSLRGQGTLSIDGQAIALQPFDLAYVPPHAVHQLRNTGNEPFGFLCIVDHVRDRPQLAPDPAPQTANMQVPALR